MSQDKTSEEYAAQPGTEDGFMNLVPTQTQYEPSPSTKARAKRNREARMNEMAQHQPETALGRAFRDARKQMSNRDGRRERRKERKRMKRLEKEQRRSSDVVDVERPKFSASQLLGNDRVYYDREKNYNSTHFDKRAMTEAERLTMLAEDEESSSSSGSSDAEDSEDESVQPTVRTRSSAGVAGAGGARHGDETLGTDTVRPVQRRRRLRGFHFDEVDNDGNAQEEAPVLNADSDDEVRPLRRRIKTRSQRAARPDGDSDSDDEVGRTAPLRPRRVNVDDEHEIARPQHRSVRTRSQRAFRPNIGVLAAPASSAQQKAVSSASSDEIIPQPRRIRTRSQRNSHSKSDDDDVQPSPPRRNVVRDPNEPVSDEELLQAQFEASSSEYDSDEQEEDNVEEVGAGGRTRRPKRAAAPQSFEGILAVQEQERRRKKRRREIMSATASAGACEIEADLQRSRLAQLRARRADRSFVGSLSQGEGAGGGYGLFHAAMDPTTLQGAVREKPLADGVAASKAASKTGSKARATKAASKAGPTKTASKAGATKTASKTRATKTASKALATKTASKARATKTASKTRATKTASKTRASDTVDLTQDATGIVDLTGKTGAKGIRKVRKRTALRGGGAGLKDDEYGGALWISGSQRQNGERTPSPDGYETPLNDIFSGEVSAWSDDDGSLEIPQVTADGVKPKSKDMQGVDSLNSGVARVITSNLPESLIVPTKGPNPDRENRSAAPVDTGNLEHDVQPLAHAEPQSDNNSVVPTVTDEPQANPQPNASTEHQDDNDSITPIVTGEPEPEQPRQRPPRRAAAPVDFKNCFAVYGNSESSAGGRVRVKQTAVRLASPRVTVAIPATRADNVRALAVLDSEFSADAWCQDVMTEVMQAYATLSAANGRAARHTCSILKVGRLRDVLHRVAAKFGAHSRSINVKGGNKAVEMYLDEGGKVVGSEDAIFKYAHSAVMEHWKIAQRVAQRKGVQQERLKGKAVRAAEKKAQGAEQRAREEKKMKEGDERQKKAEERKKDSARRRLVEQDRRNRAEQTRRNEQEEFRKNMLEMQRRQQEETRMRYEEMERARAGRRLSPKPFQPTGKPSHVFGRLRPPPPPTTGPVLNVPMGIQTFQSTPFMHPSMQIPPLRDPLGHEVDNGQWLRAVEDRMKDRGDHSARPSAAGQSTQGYRPPSEGRRHFNDRDVLYRRSWQTSGEGCPEGGRRTHCREEDAGRRANRQKREI